jgi:hypothetical protein
MMWNVEVGCGSDFMAWEPSSGVPEEKMCLRSQLQNRDGVLEMASIGES